MRDRLLRARVAMIVVGLLLAAVGYTWIVRANFTSPVAVQVTFPKTTSGTTTVGGTGDHQVARPNAGVPGTGIFSGLNPKTDGLAVFYPGFNAAGIGANDFIYFFRITNTTGTGAGGAAVFPINVFQTGYCASTITSVGIYNKPGANPTVAGQNPLLILGLVSFFFTVDVVDPGEDSAIMFFTSPDPPVRQTATISGGGGGSGGGGVSSNGQIPDTLPPNANDPLTGDPNRKLPVYGPCTPKIEVIKQVACADDNNNPVLPFVDAKDVVPGSKVVYRITIKNTGLVVLGKVQINDTQLQSASDNSPNGNLTDDFFPGTPTGGVLNAGQIISKDFVRTVVNSATPIIGIEVGPAAPPPVTVTSQYFIPSQDGTIPAVNPPCVPVIPDPATVPTVTTPDLTLKLPNIAAIKEVGTTPGSPNSLTPDAVDPNKNSFTGFPITMTYTLKATNTGQTNLGPVVIDDTKLKAIIAAPPAGITVNSVAIQGGAGFAAGTLAGGTNLPATFSLVNLTTQTMAQVNVTLTINNLAAYQVIADAADKSKFTNTMTATGLVASGEFCVTNASSSATGVFAQDFEQIMFMPPCSITLLKEVACQTPGTFSQNLTALKGASLIYRFTVTNSGQDILSNIKINDNKLAGSPFTVPGTLNPGASTSITVNATAPGTAGPFTNTATATASCQFANTSVTSNQSSATVNVLDPTLGCDKSVNGAKSVVDYVFGSPLNYKLLATNTSAGPGATNLDLTLNDLTLKNLPGVSCKRDDTNAPITLPFTFTGVPPGNSRSITCTVSFANEAAFKAASGGSTTLINTMTVTGALTDQTICVTGAQQAQLTCSSQASVSIPPPPPPPSDFCIVVPCTGPDCRGSEPGLPPPSDSPVNDQKAGSVLFYNYYNSSAVNSSSENTRFNITNTAQGTVFVHLFFVEGETCSVADSFICLSPNQTMAILASDIDPGVSGYAIAVAVDDKGCPIQWNYLIGDEYVKLRAGYSANLGAEAFSAITSPPVPCSSTSTVVPLNFDGISYSAAPRVLALDNISSPDEISTRLIINRVGGDLSSAGDTIGPLFGLLYDDLEKAYSFNFRAATCQTVQTLSDSFPRTTPRVRTVIPFGRSGWMKLWSTDGKGLLGAMLTTSSAAGGTTSVSQGHNLHKLTLGGSAVYQMPVFPPSN